MSSVLADCGEHDTTAMTDSLRFWRMLSGKLYYSLFLNSGLLLLSNDGLSNLSWATSKIHKPGTNLRPGSTKVPIIKVFLRA